VIAILFLRWGDTQLWSNYQPVGYLSGVQSTNHKANIDEQSTKELADDVSVHRERAYMDNLNDLSYVQFAAVYGDVKFLGMNREINCIIMCIMHKFVKIKSMSSMVSTSSSSPKSLDVTLAMNSIIDSGCSKHMKGNRTMLTNFVEKFFGTVRFGNNDFAVIAGYGDVVIDGVDLLTDDRSSNLYTIALDEVASNSLTCLLAKASSSQSWLWHQRLSHLNFATINNLVKNNLVQGLPKMKFEKDHLCSACEQGKIHRKHHKSKMAFASNKPLYLLHIDLCGSMRVQSINGKQYVLVVIDDYSRYTWVFFLHSKDEAFEVIISFIKKTQVNLQL
nr:hypothetical protein [Tanacetum cinerariifolium]